LANELAEGPPQPQEIKNPADCFFRWVPDDFTKGPEHKLQPGAFGKERDIDEGISFDWSRYSTPRRTLERSTKPEIRAGVVKTTAGQMWDRELNVRHAPETANPAHSLVTGPSYTRIRKTLVEICTWEIELPPDE